jgi:ATP-grasp domain
MKQKILLATTVNWPSAARLAGAFSMLGARVEAVFPRDHVLGACRYVDRTHRYRPLHAVQSMADAVAAAAPDFVIPCDDRALMLLLSLDGFRPLLERSLGPLQSYRVLTARAPSIAAAREEGITAPLTLAVPDLACLKDALAQVGLPCVMKTDGSWGGGGVKFVRTLDDAERAFGQLECPPSRLRSLTRAVLRRDLNFLAEALEPRPAPVNVQALVAGKPATSVFAARDGKVLAALHMDVVTWSGDTGPASLMQRTASRQMDEAVRKIAARFKLNGLQGLDYVRDRDGTPHLIEINPRATQICHLALGPDLPAALLGQPARPRVTECTRIALFPQLVEMPDLAGSVYQDIPWDDPAVLRAAAGDGLPEAVELEVIPEFARAAGGPPIVRRHA